MVKIYLCSPYSHHDPNVCHARFEAVNRKAAELMRKGHVVFSPISHSVCIADHIGNHLDQDFWLNQDVAFLPWCDEVWVLKLEGWTESTGIKKELKMARKLKKKVRKIEP